MYKIIKTDIYKTYIVAEVKTIKEAKKVVKREKERGGIIRVKKYD